MNTSKQPRQDYQESLKKSVLEAFAKAKSKNSLYSIRSFSKKLGVSPASLSQILSGKRKLTKKTAETILSRLNLDPKEHRRIEEQIRQQKKSLSGARSAYVQLQMDQYYMMSEWYYFAILSFAETSNFSENPAWVAKRLGIRTQEAQKALETLERLGLLKRDEKRKLVSSGQSFRTTTDISNVLIQKNHFDNLERARLSLEKDSVELRDFSSMTMAIDADLIPEAKVLIRDFRRSLCELLESGENKKEVYKLNIQLFPLTNREDNL